MDDIESGDYIWDPIPPSTGVVGEVSDEFISIYWLYEDETHPTGRRESTYSRSDLLWRGWTILNPYDLRKVE